MYTSYKKSLTILVRCYYYTYVVIYTNVQNKGYTEYMSTYSLVNLKKTNFSYIIRILGV